MKIWVPRTKIIEPKEAIPFAGQFAGRIKLRVLDAATRKVKREVGWFPNLVLNQGLDLIGTSASWLSACRVGSSTVAPTNSDTNLAGHIAGTTTKVSDTTTNSNAPDYYSSRIITYEFAAGVATGTIGEIGIGTVSASGDTLFSRALVLDAASLPVTISVIASDILQVTYECRHYPPIVDGTGVVTIGGFNYNWTSRALNIGSQAIWAPEMISTITTSLAQVSATAMGANTDTSIAGGSSTGTSSQSGFPYTTGNYFREWSTLFSLSQANLSPGIRTYSKTLNGATVQVGFSRVGGSPDHIPKLNTQTLLLVFRWAWTRRPPL